MVGSFPVSSKFGLAQGFDRYDETFTESFALNGEASFDALRVPADRSEGAESVPSIPHDSVGADPDVTNVAVAWLRQSVEQPFFLWVHYIGPHSRPNTPSDGILRMRKTHVETYDAKVKVPIARLDASSKNSEC